MARLQELIFLLLCFSVVPCVTSCPNGYTKVGSSHCYKLHTEQVTWNEAEKSCNGSAGRLASIDSATDTKQVARFISDTNVYPVDKIWIGLRRTRTDWRWLAGAYIQAQGCYLLDQLQGAPFNMPSSRRGRAYTPEKCVSECKADGSLYSGLIRIKGDEMECRCSDTFTANYLAVVPCVWKCPTDRMLYCGRQEPETSGDERLAVLVSRTDVPQDLIHWRRGQPNNFFPYRAPYQACIALTAFNSHLCLADETCYEMTFEPNDEPYSHLCEYITDGSEKQCTKIHKDSVMTHEGRCYSVHVNSAKNWFAARQDCMSRNGELLSLTSPDLLESLIVTLPTFDLGMTRWWVGGTNELWSWTEGMEASGFTYWASDRPSRDTLDCVSMDRNTRPDPWGWDEEPCDHKHQYLCQADLLDIKKDKVEEETKKIANIKILSQNASNDESSTLSTSSTTSVSSTTSTTSTTSSTTSTSTTTPTTSTSTSTSTPSTTSSSSTSASTTSTTPTTKKKKVPTATLR